jgi:hypothetical protein
VAGESTARPPGLLWRAFLAAPTAWTLNQGIGYAAMRPVCANEATAFLWFVATVTLAIASAAAWTSWRLAQQLRAAHQHDDGPFDSGYFVAVVSTAFNVLIGLLIVTATIPQFLLSPCE